MILYFHIFALSIQIKILYRIFHTNIFKKKEIKQVEIMQQLCHLQRHWH